MNSSGNSWYSLFRERKPILAMLNLGGEDHSARLKRAIEEAASLIAGGVDGLIVENYFGDTDDVRAALEYLAKELPAVAIGLNVLRNFELAFSLAQEFPVDFIQIDSIVGHLDEEDDRVYAERLADLRAASPALLFGGVRFKYQPVLSGRSEADDLKIGMTRCDAIVVTGSGTGVETELAKLVRFRQAVGSAFPLIVGAGVTDTNVRSQLEIVDGAIVGSFLKDNYHADGVVDISHVKRLLGASAQVQSPESREI